MDTMCVLMGSCRMVWSYALMHDDDRCIALRWGSISTWNDDFLCIFKTIHVVVSVVVISTGDARSRSSPDHQHLLESISLVDISGLEHSVAGIWHIRRGD